MNRKNSGGGLRKQRLTRQQMKVLVVFGTTIPLAAVMADGLHVFSTGEIVSSSKLNENFTFLESATVELNGLVTDLDARLLPYEAAISIDGANNIGIGTTSPTSELEVNGTITANAFVGDGSSLTGISGLSQWSNGTGSIYYNSGNVGVGTLSPDGKLDVRADNIFLGPGTNTTDGGTVTVREDGVDSVLTTHAAGFGSLAIGFDVSADRGVVGVDEGGVGGQDIAFMTDLSFGSDIFSTSSPKMIIKGDGAVGIGTSDPVEALEVNGTVLASAFVGDGSGLTGIDGLSQWSDVSGGISFTSGSVGVGILTPQDSLHIASPGTSAVNGSIANSYPATRITVRTTSDGIERGLQFGAPSSGVTAPVFIKVFGTSNRFAFLNENNTETMTILTGGNIGIGTTTPSAKLQVAGGSNLDGTVRIPNNTQLFWQTSGGGNGFRLYQGSDDKFYVHNGGQEIARFDNTNRSLSIGGTYVATAAPTDGLLVQGSVGFGTTSPTEALQVEGTVMATAFVGDGSGITGIDGLTQWSDITGGIAYTGGAVGIGTSAPVQKFEVSDSGNIRLVIRNSTESTSYNNSVDWVTGSGSLNSTNVVGRVQGVISQADPSALIGDLAFHTNAGDSVIERMRILGNGFVGMGTTSPKVQLHVENSSGFAGVGVAGKGSETASYLFWNLDNSGAYDGSSVADKKLIADMQARPSGTAGTYGGNIVFRTKPDNAGGLGDRMAITSAGLVGVGTTAPSGRFDAVVGNSQSLSAGRFITGTSYSGTIIRGSTASSDDPNYNLLLLGNASSEKFLVRGDGNVGIGTTSPDYMLDVEGGYRLIGTDGSYLWSERGDSVLDLLIGSNSSERGLSIHASNTGTSANLLEIYGHNGSTYVTAVGVTNTGRLGVGTLSPSERLGVEGNVIASSYLTSSDRRLKSDIEPLVDASAGIQCLEARTYRWTDPNQSQNVQMGFIAQDVEMCFPDIVTTDESGYKSIAYSQLLAPLVETVKEQQHGLSDLREEVKRLRADQARALEALAATNARLSRLEAVLAK